MLFARVGSVIRFLFFGVSMFFGSSRCLENGLALTPPMGWLSWERFGCQINCTVWPDSCVSEKLYLIQGRLMLEHGYLDAGYEYVRIDDCWSAPERENGTLVEDKIRFPHGLKKLSSTLHSWGLKVGLYGDIGTQTCVGYPGFEGHFEQDAWTLAHEFEIDAIKVDACHANESEFNITYPAFGQALNKTGRRILYSCCWPSDYYEQHNHWEKPDYLNHGIKQTCNTWRNFNDVFDSWQSVSNIIDFWARLGPADVMVKAGGPGGWNDPDMLVVGNPGLSISEQQAQFALYAIFAAPLMMSTDLRTISEESKAILLNSEIIAVNQDPLGRQGWCSGRKPLPENSRVWIRELVPTWWNNSNKVLHDCPPQTSDSWAVVLENQNTIFWRQTITFDPQVHLPNGHLWHSFFVRDLIARKDLGIFENNFTALVDESSVAMFQVFFISFGASSKSEQDDKLQTTRSRSFE
jgi:Alpha galactosidase A